MKNPALGRGEENDEGFTRRRAPRHAGDQGMDERGMIAILFHKAEHLIGDHTLLAGACQAFCGQGPVHFDIL
jgi:hypothetical protein